MRLFQYTVAMALLAVCSSQYLPGFFSRKQMTDSALYKFLSAVRGGGRGHRELLSITGSGSNPASVQALPPQSPLFRLPQGVTHIPPPPKIGAFYITPPEHNAPFYYGGPRGGRRPHLFKISDLKNGAPMTFLTAESSNRPGPLQLVQFNGPIAAASNNNAGPPQPGAPGGSPIGPSGPSGSSSAGSLQEIIAKAAQQQHAAVLQKEQKAHPSAKITNSQILIPGGGVGQQPIFINQYGQPFLAPAILAPGQQGQQLPPQFLSNGLFPILTQGPAQGQPQSINQIPQQLQKAQPQPHQQQQQQQIPLQLLAGGIQFTPQGQPYRLIPAGAGDQRVPIPLQAHQLPGGGQILSLPPGAQNILSGQFAILPQGGSLNSVRGLQGPLIPGNAIFGHPHFALVGGPNPPQIKSSQPQQTKAEKEEQPTRPQEAVSQIITSSIHPSAPSDSNSNNVQGQMTAAIMQSQLEFSEPIVKA